MSEIVDRGLQGWRWGLAVVLVLAGALAATVPTTGDIGLTWDEPAYRYSQLMSAQWWDRLAHARTRAELVDLFDADTLLYYWPYARYGRNFHPPLAGQLNLATHAVFGRWMQDLPSRRLASVFEYALTIALGFGFLARRYGPWVGGVTAGALLLMPRVYGDGHIAGTDTPGMLLWAAAALAFWKGLYEPDARRWRVAVGVLLGLAFLEKMAAVMVLGPILVWLVVSRLPKARRADWGDGLLTTTAMLAPLGVAFFEVLRLAKRFPPPAQVNLFNHPNPSALPGLVLAVPLAVWIVRRALGRLRRNSPLWGVERPALETWTAILAFAPVISWLGNPAWWRETLPRLAHYYAISTARRGALPDIRIFYLGQTYEFSLPWHNAWVLIAVTVPASLLIASLLGVISTFWNLRRDRLPLYFLLHLVTLPALRMLPTPAHDGVRLFLPTFFFLAAMVGWGAVGLADGVTRVARMGSIRMPRPVAVAQAAPTEQGLRRALPTFFMLAVLMRRGVVWFAEGVQRAVPRRAGWWRAVAAGLVLGPAAWQLIRIHPYELSYYNEFIGGPRGAWRRGFELSYWYDAFNAPVLADLNARFPKGAVVDFLNPKENPDTFYELQTLGHLRTDVRLGARSANEFPYVWLLTHDSKATPFTRLLFALEPWYASCPRPLDRRKVATVADPIAVSRAWALQLLCSDVRTDPPPPPAAPAWLRRFAPALARFWGDGLTMVPAPGVNEALFDWAKDDPDGLRAAARSVAYPGAPTDPGATRRLQTILSRFDQPDKPGGFLSRRLLNARPEALIEAVAIVINRPDQLRKVLTYPGYTDSGGWLDVDFYSSRLDSY